MKYILSFFCFAVCCSSCNNNQESQIQSTLEVAESNRSELEKVLSYFENEKPDKLKREAARYLLANMSGHTSMQGRRMEVYKEMVRVAKKPIPKDTLEAIWERAKAIKGGMDEEEDAVLISSDYLIRHIEQSVEGWKHAPWKDRVSFEDFCRYILPYRVNTEQLASGWIDSLRTRYAPAIEGIKDMKTAYMAVLKKLDKEYRESEVSCPYTPDILTLDNMKMGPCKDQCMLAAAVLRALSIPAVYDYVTHWTNYSRVGHSWVALVDGGETYTWEKKDTEVRKAVRIPASVMKAEAVPEKDYPYSVDTLKRVSKVYRMLYTTNTPEDVSETYQLKGYCKMEVPEAVEAVYLCTFRTGRDWEPVDAAYVRRGECRFANLGCGTVYLLMKKECGRLFSVSIPFILHENGKIERLVADKQARETVVLTRKYPLMGNWISQWHKMIGGKLEASNRPDFLPATVLDNIAETPVYKNRFRIPHVEEAYRYVRYVCPDNCRTPLAELEFYEASTGKLLIGEPIGSERLSERSMRQTFDRDLMSVCSSKKKYWVGLDLKTKRRIGEVVLYPKNDGNFIDIGDCYELFYYDKGWVSLGRQTASGLSLVYRNVPKGSLLLLKDHTKGKEERVFVYRHDRQVWG